MSILQDVYDSNGYKALMRLNVFGLIQYAFDDFIKRNVPLITGSRVLDAGCGYGLISSAINKTAENLGVEIEQHAFDLSMSMPSALKEYAKGPIKITCSDARHLSYGDKVFDVIICAGMFEHIKNPVEVLTEYSRCLKEGGQLIVFVSPKNIFTRMILSRFGNSWAYSYTEFLPYLHRAGFKNTKRLYFVRQHIWANFSYFAIKAHF